ncbi:serine O-acetyltransferase [Undibacterium parvum]|uniref:Serine acetyltransferase n=2 Tax=Undibacterium TaxID=401469 RepID=A0A6M4A2D1_9BURK|nr:DapH/DapD/GlmU-related protein [Undibacterium parvum]AZP10944.1 serine acetyltransferase [Undibacterium parvum]QJQ05512.1 serine acetyltransferase [Undibacterium piscinae]
MVLFIQKISHKLWRLGIPVLPRVLYALNRVLFAAAIPPSVQIGTNVLLGYSGLGIVIHANAVIGNNVKISQNVTIGGRSGFVNVPVLEDGVQIGAGACILGPIRICKNALVGANAVVLCDVPEGKTVVGVPARII